MKKLFSCIVWAICLTTLCAANVHGQADDVADNRWSGGTFFTPANGYAQGNALTLTWSITGDGTSIFGFNGEPTSDSDLIAMLDAVYGAGPGGSDLTQRPWFDEVESVFDRWASISGLSYQYVTDDNADWTQTSLPSGVSGARGDIRIGGHTIDGPNGVLAYNFFPNFGDMVIDTTDAANFSNELRLRNTIAHEVGHGLGLRHLESNDSRHLLEPFIDLNFDGPQFHEIVQAQRGYGDAFEKTNGGVGNDTVGNATSLGTLSDGGLIEIGLDASDTTTIVTPDQVDFVSIDDETDTDVFSILINGDGLIDLELEARGPTFNASEQFDTDPQVSVNYQERVDLTLEFIDQDGTTILGTADNFGLGGTEELLGLNVTAGTYFIRVSGIENTDANLSDIQFYRLAAAFTAVPEPSSLVVLGALGLFVLRRKRS